MTRIYVASTLDGLRSLLRDGVLRQAPFAAFAVTSELRAHYPDADDEELEYAATSLAADESLRALVARQPRPGDERRLVIACDVSAASVAEEPEDGAAGVVVSVAPTMAQVASVLCDDPDAVSDISTALLVLQTARSEDDNVLRVLESLDDHELLWYATQETAELVGDRRDG